MSYRIGSFNLMKFSYSDDKGEKKDFQLIADIIEKEKFDIVALQEVFSKDAVKHLCSFFRSRDWAYRVQIPPNSAEGYAFIWNKQTMELSFYLDKFGNKIPIEPHIYKQYCQYYIGPEHSGKKLSRNPFYGRFKPKNLYCELRLLNTHIRFGKRDDESESEWKMRQKEYDILTRQLYYQISSRQYEPSAQNNNMPSYTILLGDYNLNLRREYEKNGILFFRTKSPYLVEKIEIDDNGHKKTIQTFQDQLTSLKQKVDESQSENDLRGYSNNYDHFTYEPQRFDGTYCKTRRIDAVRKYCNDDFSLYRKTVSDHIPIVMSLNLRNEQEE